METNAKVKICSRVSLTSGVCCTTQNVIQNVQNFNTALCSYVDSKKRRLFTSNDEYVFPFLLFGALWYNNHIIHQTINLASWPTFSTFICAAICLQFKFHKNSTTHHHSSSIGNGALTEAYGKKLKSQNFNRQMKPAMWQISFLKGGSIFLKSSQYKKANLCMLYEKIDHKGRRLYFEQLAASVLVKRVIDWSLWHVCVCGVHDADMSESWELLLFKTNVSAGLRP